MAILLTSRYKPTAFNERSFTYSSPPGCHTEGKILTHKVALWMSGTKAIVLDKFLDLGSSPGLLRCISTLLSLSITSQTIFKIKVVSPKKRKPT